jgi:hypothetical protein
VQNFWSEGRSIRHAARSNKFDDRSLWTFTFSLTQLHVEVRRPIIAIRVNEELSEMWSGHQQVLLGLLDPACTQRHFHSSNFIIGHISIFHEIYCELLLYGLFNDALSIQTVLDCVVRERKWPWPTLAGELLSGFEPWTSWKESWKR